jgi:hypothetical protein
VSAPHSILQKKIEAMFEADRSSVRLRRCHGYSMVKALLNLGQVRAAENIGGDGRQIPG